MHAGTEPRRIWIDGAPIEVWEHPQVRFSWTPSAIRGYVRTEQWEPAFNALVLLCSGEVKGTA
jgi:hypothetical protein